MKAKRQRPSRATTLAASRDVACLVSEQGGVGEAAQRAGVDGDELYRAGRLTSELYLGPVRPPRGGGLGIADSSRLELELLWQTVVLIGLRLRGDYVPAPGSIGRAVIRVHERELEQQIEAQLGVGGRLALISGLGNTFLMLALGARADARHDTCGCALTMLDHALAVAFTA